jgi:hypothetical protein
MKYIVYWAMDPKDWEKGSELSNKMTEERKKHPDKYTRVISANYSLGESKGFILVEADNEEQMLNVISFYHPCVVFNYVPIIEASKVTAALREKNKK